jgi:putative peptidoglycan lipid II flippase
MMSTLTLVSRITGLLRAWTMAIVLGTYVLGAAYSVVNNIPNMIFEFVAGGIISSLFIPTFMELREQKSDDEAWRFTSHIFNLTVLSLGIIGVIGVLFPAPFVWTQTFRLPPAQAALVVPVATYLFRFFALQVVLYGAGSIISALLNSHRQYFWPAVGPIFNNLVAIASMLAFAALGGKLTGPNMTTGLAPMVLAGGTTLAVVVMFAVQVPAVLKTGWRWSPGLGLHDPAIRRLLRLAVPTVIYVATNLIAVSFRNASAFAAIPNSSGPAILTYAWMFYQLPYGILAVALATAVFTELADAAGRQDTDEFRSIFARGLRATGVLILPTSAVLVALATPLIRLFRFGAFTAADIPLVAGALRWWAAGLIFYATTMYLLRTFYSLKDTYTPMVVNLFLTFGVQIVLYWVLTTGIGSWPGIGIDGIPIADSIFYLCLSAVLVVLMRRRIGEFGTRGVALTYVRMTIASVIGALVAWGVSALIAPVVLGVSGALLQIAVGGIAGLVVAFGLGKLLGVTEVSSATQLLTRALRRRGGAS